MTGISNFEHLPLMSVKDFGYNRLEHLHLKREAEKVLELGTRVANSCFVLRWCDQAKSLSELSGKNTPSRRIAIRIPREFGSAPERNRAKRIVREIFRHEKSRLRERIDLIVKIKPLANPAQLHLNYLRPQFLKLCATAGILIKDGVLHG